MRALAAVTVAARTPQQELRYRAAIYDATDRAMRVLQLAALEYKAAVDLCGWVMYVYADLRKEDGTALTDEQLAELVRVAIGEARAFYEDKVMEQHKGG